MNAKTRLISILLIIVATSSVYANVTDQKSWASLDEETQISISILGSDVIDLDSTNRLIRANVEVINYNPSDGYYFMHIIQPVTEKTISKEEIIIRAKSNGLAGASVAKMIHDEEIMVNGTALQGDYKLLITTERGDKTASTKFSIIKNSDAFRTNTQNESEAEIDEDDPELIQPAQLKAPAANSVQTNTAQESTQTSPNEVNNNKLVPEWVRSIFVLYANGSISENELITAIKYLVQQGIITI
jgi:hypothetical protein